VPDDGAILPAPTDPPERPLIPRCSGSDNTFCVAYASRQHCFSCNQRFGPRGKRSVAATNVSVEALHHLGPEDFTPPAHLSLSGGIGNAHSVRSLPRRGNSAATVFSRVKKWRARKDDVRNRRPLVLAGWWHKPPTTRRPAISHNARRHAQTQRQGKESILRCRDVANFSASSPADRCTFGSRRGETIAAEMQLIDRSDWYIWGEWPKIAQCR
jgi:hypothetical protein